MERSDCDLLKDLVDKSLLKNAQSYRRLAGFGLLEKPRQHSRDAVLPRPGGPDPLHFSRSVSVVHFGRCASSSPRARASLGSQNISFKRSGHVCREEKNIHQQVDPGSRVRRPPSERVGSLLLCLLQSATFGAGAAGCQFWGPTRASFPAGFVKKHIFLISQINYLFCVWNLKLIFTELQVTDYPGFSVPGFNKVILFVTTVMQCVRDGVSWCVLCDGVMVCDGVMCVTVRTQLFTWFTHEH